MDKIYVFELVERIAALIRSEERKKCAEYGLQTVHLQALDYISRCNRFSDTPAALTRYLGLTKGTVSQTLQILEKKGYIEKRPDGVDKRMVHLKLLPSGDDILTKARPHELFDHASEILKEHDFQSYEDVFSQTLTALQKANKSQAFGLCKTCRHFTHSPEGFVCGLTKESLSRVDSEKICQEHTVC
ncbi:MAG: MarR family winged helix-turn-helix transcriptional regulator [Gammaproteobacteria bacterium]